VVQDGCWRRRAEGTRSGSLELQRHGAAGRPGVAASSGNIPVSWSMRRSTGVGALT
jgi:hypothetical protein